MVEKWDISDKIYGESIAIKFFLVKSSLLYFSTQITQVFLKTSNENIYSQKYYLNFLIL